MAYRRFVEHMEDTNWVTLVDTDEGVEVRIDGVGVLLLSNYTDMIQLIASGDSSLMHDDEGFPMVAVEDLVLVRPEEEE